MVKLTIITPTYNRAHTISRCYESLLQQSNTEFEWIVVDDGSTDETQELFSTFNTDRFPVIKLHKANGGKHTALNAAHPHIHGEYVLILDSDDYLVKTAVEEVLRAWERFEKDQSVGIVTFLKGVSEDQPVCTVADYDIPVDIMRYRRQKHYGSDCCEVIRTELFRKYPFPEFEGENFIGEGVAVFPMELESKGVYFNEVLYLCSYREDGLTKAGRKMRIANSRGGMINSKTYMHPRLPFKTRIKKGILYSCYAKFAGVGFRKLLRENPYKILTLTTYLPGRCLAAYWRRKHAD